MHRYIGFALAASIAPAAAAQADPQRAIEAAMADSAAGWDQGDLQRFVAVYADDAIYAAGADVVLGRDAIAARYAKSFTAGGNKRGALSFRYLAWKRVGSAHLLLVARWTLTPTGGAKADTGLTTLLFEQRPEGWRIISDHSS